MPAQAAGQTGVGAPPATHALLTTTLAPACGRPAPGGWISGGRVVFDLTLISCPLCAAALTKSGR
jgi:hypothetical protein